MTSKYAGSKIAYKRGRKLKYLNTRSQQTVKAILILFVLHIYLHVFIYILSYSINLTFKTFSSSRYFAVITFKYKKYRNGILFSNSYIAIDNSVFCCFKVDI